MSHDSKFKPFDRWMRVPLHPRLEEMMDVGAQAPWLRRGAATRIWSDYQAGNAHWSRAWAVAVLQSRFVAGN